MRSSLAPSFPDRLFGLAIACFALIAAVKFGFIWQGGGVQLVDGPAGTRTLIADLFDDAKGTFAVEGPADETYMLFFGSVGGSPVAHGQFFGAGLSDGQHLLKRYPDFHRCVEGGAEPMAGEEFARSYHGRFKKSFLHLESLETRDCKDAL